MNWRKGLRWVAYVVGGFCTLMIAGAVFIGRPAAEREARERAEAADPARVAVKAKAEAAARLKHEEQRAKAAESAKIEQAKADAQAMAYRLCRAAQEAADASVRNKTDFPSCMLGGGGLTVTPGPQGGLTVRGPMTFMNAFNAEMKATYEVDLVGGPEEWRAIRARVK